MRTYSEISGGARPPESVKGRKGPAAPLKERLYNLKLVEHDAVNLITGLKGKSYLEKLQELGLMSLEQRRSKFDLLQTFKIIKGFDNVSRDIWFDLVGPDNPRPQN